MPGLKRMSLPPSRRTAIEGAASPARRAWLRRAGAAAALAALEPGWAAAPATPTARRLVCVGGALTEIVYALQAQADLVGVDTTSLYPAAAQRLPSVGYARSLSVEGVLALAPTQILATEDAGPPTVLRQLGAAGVPVAVLAAGHRFEGLCERVQRVGELTGRGREAAELVQRLQQDWSRARTAIARRTGPAPRVLFVLAHTPAQVMVAGRDTSAQAMLDYVGARNAIDGFAGYKPLTPEAVIAARPDLLLLTDQGLQAAGGVEGVLRLPGLAQTPAGRQRRVASLEAMYLLGFGPRLPAALLDLDAALSHSLSS